eukprot:9283097-Pyramimonas_sp.AAC.1
MRGCCSASDASQLAAPSVRSVISLLAWRVLIRHADRQRCLPSASRLAAAADMHTSAVLLSSQVLLYRFTE